MKKHVRLVFSLVTAMPCFSLESMGNRELNLRVQAGGQDIGVGEAKRRVLMCWRMSSEMCWHMC